MTDFKTIIVGELEKTIAKEISVLPGKIELNERAYNHILEDHRKELERVGMTPISFVQFVMQNFNEIRKGRTNELFLVVKNGLSKIAVIRMNYETKVYRIGTATVIRNSFINKKDLLWKK